jgi:hypothetical protein
MHRPARAADGEAVPTTASDLQALRNASRVLDNENDAAREVALHCADALAHTEAGMALYDRQWGTFSLDADHNERVVLASVMQGLEHRLQGRRQHFLHECRARHSLMQMLPTVTPVDPAWLDISAQRERFKLCFANGYWDFSEGRFLVPRAPLPHGRARAIATARPAVHRPGAGGGLYAAIQQRGRARLHAQGAGEGSGRRPGGEAGLLHPR